MTALRFFKRRPAVGASQRVHTGDPDRLPHYTMCGVDIDSNYVDVSDPRAFVGARPCERCDGMRELAEERASRARGIIGGWEATCAPLPTGDVEHAWHARDSIGQIWIVHENGSYGHTRSRTFVACVIVNSVIRHVRKLGQSKRAKWRTDAIAMRACEDLARSGEYLLDRPAHKKGAA